MAKPLFVATAAAVRNAFVARVARHLKSQGDRVSESRRRVKDHVRDDPAHAPLICWFVTWVIFHTSPVTRVFGLPDLKTSRNTCNGRVSASLSPLPQTMALPCGRTTRLAVSLIVCGLGKTWSTSMATSRAVAPNSRTLPCSPSYLTLHTVYNTWPGPVTSGRGGRVTQVHGQLSVKTVGLSVYFKMCLFGGEEQYTVCRPESILPAGDLRSELSKSSTEAGALPSFLRRK